MRKYFALIKESESDDREGMVESRSKPHAGEKGEPTRRILMNKDTEERTEETIIPLGYHDFDDSQDYKNRMGEVIERKMEEANQNG